MRRKSCSVSRERVQETRLGPTAAARKKLAPPPPGATALPTARRLPSSKKLYLRATPAKQDTRSRRADDKNVFPNPEGVEPWTNFSAQKGQVPGQTLEGRDGGVVTETVAIRITTLETGGLLESAGEGGGRSSYPGGGGGGQISSPGCQGPLSLEGF